MDTKFVILLIAAIGIIFFCFTKTETFVSEGEPSASECLKECKEQSLKECESAYGNSEFCHQKPEQCKAFMKKCQEDQFKKTCLEPCYKYCMTGCGNWKSGCANKCLKEVGSSHNINPHPPTNQCLRVIDSCIKDGLTPYQCESWRLGNLCDWRGCSDCIGKCHDYPGKYCVSKICKQFCYDANFIPNLPG